MTEDVTGIPFRTYYEQTNGEKMTFQAYMSENGLMMKFVGVISERLDMYPTDKDAFLLRSQLTGTRVFSNDGSGKVTGFTIALQEGGSIVATKRRSSSNRPYSQGLMGPD